MKLWTEIKTTFYRYRFAYRCAAKVFWIQAEDLRVQASASLAKTTSISGAPIPSQEESFMHNWRQELAFKMARMIEAEIADKSNKGAFNG